MLNMVFEPANVASPEVFPRLPLLRPQFAEARREGATLRVYQVHLFTTPQHTLVAKALFAHEFTREYDTTLHIGHRPGPMILAHLIFLLIPGQVMSAEDA